MDVISTLYFNLGIITIALVVILLNYKNYSSIKLKKKISFINDELVSKTKGLMFFTYFLTALYAIIELVSPIEVKKIAGVFALTYTISLILLRLGRLK